MSEKPRRLGRGLEALLGSAQTASRPLAVDPSESTAQRESLRQIPIAKIQPNRFQPRKEFREEDLTEMQASLSATGLLQPITVRAVGDHYELIAGERRMRAAARLGWSDIPAIVRDYNDRESLTLALVENLQRADLNPVEEAQGYSRLLTEFGLTQQQIATAVGKDRSTVANSLRILNLPTSVLELVQAGQLSLGHARALLGVPAEHVMVDLAREAIAKNLSVREIERRVKQVGTSARPPKDTIARPEPSPARTAEVRRLTDRLRRRLQTDVNLDVDDKDRGQLRIAFYSADDLNRLIELITGHTTEDL